jgi:hypothetical protein
VEVPKPIQLVAVMAMASVFDPDPVATSCRPFVETEVAVVIRDMMDVHDVPLVLL